MNMLIKMTPIADESVVSCWLPTAIYLPFNISITHAGLCHRIRL